MKGEASHLAASHRPSDGVIQNNSTSNKFQAYTNNQWNSVAFDNNPLQIGGAACGDINFWLDESGKYGLVASSSDLSTTYKWGNYLNIYRLKYHPVGLVILLKLTLTLY